MSKLNPQKIDIALIESIIKGDQSAFRTVFNQLKKRLRYFVLSYIKSEYAADEIVQESFIRVWQKRESLKPPTFTTFVFTIARNLTYNHIRDTLRRESAKEEFCKNAGSGSYEQVESQIVFGEYTRLVSHIIDTLPPQRKSIYILSRQEGKTNSEIAAILGITPKTVKNHLWKVMETLKTRLSPHIGNSPAFLLFLLFC